MKKSIQSNHYTQKKAIRQKFGFILKWVAIFLGFMLVSMIAGPIFLTNHQQALHLSNFLNHYRVVFWLLHLVFVLSALWWWPAYVRARGKRNQWSQEMINRAVDWKWAVMLVLALLCILFLLS